jgi:hypothetical protein
VKRSRSDLVKLIKTRSHGDIRPILEAALDQGWSVRLTTGCHWILTSPTGQTASAPGSPRNGCRSIENTKAQARRAGLVLPRKHTKGRPR